ncbi:unnamed protein product, partial [Meganyctiphanes norvegica]
MGHNEHSDLSYEEVLLRLTGALEERQGRAMGNWYRGEQLGHEPENINHSVMMNPIRNQKHTTETECGSSWAFSAIASIEGLLYKTLNERMILSEQKLIDCGKGVAFPDDGSHTGCDGGWTGGAIRYVGINNGIDDGNQYKYTGKGNKPCTNDKKPNFHVYRVGVQFIDAHNESKLMNALWKGVPLTVYVFVSPNFRHYAGEIFKYDKSLYCGGKNHAMVLVGYDKNHWILRNSWGVTWGEKGYMKLARDQKCLFARQGFIPKFVDSRAEAEASKSEDQLVLAGSALGDAGASISHDEFVKKYNKSYKDEAEKNNRSTIYQINVEVMEKHNILYAKGESSYKMGVNKYSDLTYDEVLKYLTGALEPMDTRKRRESKCNSIYRENTGTLKDSKDYRKEITFNPIQDQNYCGSCWAFSAIASIESKIFIESGQLVKLSEQNLIDCAKGVAFKGCSGGRPGRAIEYVSNNGIALNKNYPYENKEGNCNEDVSTQKYNVTGKQRVEPRNEEVLLHALEYTGPISVNVILPDSMRHYKKGVYEDELCKKRSEPINHAMVLMGYGNELGKDFWILRNSWGESFGEEGYMKLRRNKRNHCKIASFAFIPQIKGSKAECVGGSTGGKKGGYVTSAGSAVGDAG